MMSCPVEGREATPLWAGVREWTHHPLGFAIAAGAALLVLEFGFFLVTPRLLLDLSADLSTSQAPKSPGLE